MSEIIFEEATLDELLDYLASMEESAVEEVRERIADIKAELAALREAAQESLNHTAKPYTYEGDIKLVALLQEKGE